MKQFLAAFQKNYGHKINVDFMVKKSRNVWRYTARLSVKGRMVWPVFLYQLGRRDGPAN